MNFFISGGAGFIGTNLLEHLSKNYPNSKITIYDNFKFSYKNFFKVLKSLNNNNINVIKADLNNVRKLSSSLPTKAIIIHLAANADIAASINNPLLDFNSTIITSNLLEASRKKNVKHFIFTSGSGVYGDSKKVLHENKLDGIDPVSFYGASKLGCEGLIYAYSNMYGIKVTVFRMANIIGKYATHGVIHDLLKKLNKNPKKLVVLGNGGQNKSYLHISDLLRVIDKVIVEKKKLPKTINVSTNDLITVKKIVSRIIKITQIKPKIIYTGGEIGWKGDVSYIKLSNNLLKKYGWRPKFSSLRAVDKTIAENLDLLF